jgi:hypothetical protein
VPASSGSGSGSGSGSDAVPPPPRPSLTPTPQLILAAMDLHDQYIPRMSTPWQLPLTQALADAGGFPQLEACVPPSGGTFPGREPLYVAGPLLLAGSNAVVVALSCNVSGTAAAAGGGDAAGEPSPPVLLSFAIDAPNRPVPSLLWATNMTGTGAAPGTLFRSLFLDAQSGQDESVVWLSPLGGDTLVAVDASAAGRGRQLAAVNVTALLQQQQQQQQEEEEEDEREQASSCPRLAVTQRVALSGRPVASPYLGADGSSNATLAIVGGEVVQGSGSGGNGSGSFWALGLVVSEAGSNVAWCVALPGPMEGQPALVQDGTGAGTGILVLATREAVMGWA